MAEVLQRQGDLHETKCLEATQTDNKKWELTREDSVWEGKEESLYATSTPDPSYGVSVRRSSLVPPQQGDVYDGILITAARRSLCVVPGDADTHLSSERKESVPTVFTYNGTCFKQNILETASQLDCAATGAWFQIVAHQDDDLLFLNPSLLRAVRAGRDIITVYLTAGDAGRPEPYWRGREAGVRAAGANKDSTRKMNRPCPTLWTDPMRNPTLTLAYITWPAYSVPLLVAAAFLFTKPWRCLFVRHDDQLQQRRVGNPLANWVNDGLQRAFEVGDLQQQVDGLIVISHIIYTGNALRRCGEPYQAELMVNCCFEALTLLAAAIYSEPARMVPYCVTAMGWILLPLHKTVSAAPAALLALPCAWQLVEKTRIWEWNSGTLLFIMAYNLDPRLQPPNLRAAEEYLCSRTLVLYLFCMLIGTSFRLGNITLVAHALESRVLADVSRFAAEALRLIAFLVALLGPAAAFATIAAFCYSCIGWQWLLYQRPANRPGFSLPSLVFGGLTYLHLWVVAAVVRATTRPARWRTAVSALLYSEILFCADILGLSCTIMIAHWWLLIRLRLKECLGAYGV
nr:hypothetical protein B0A51_12418 [Rachicladosporium sp. CCFEE 5018]